jgi:hypothetical protein
MSPDPRLDEWLTCSESPGYFLWHHVFVYDATSLAWLPFELWPAQAQTLRTITANRLVIILKARQLGLTWLALGYALWLMLFRPASTVLLFSRRDDEAIYSLGFRLKGMYGRLPAWMRARAIARDNAHTWQLSNGSMALAFPTTGGDSYTASCVVVDEADLLPNLAKLLSAVKPTIDAGGQLILLGRVDKAKPASTFKAIYRAAQEQRNDWAPVFLPWSARPGRDAAWYEAQRADFLARDEPDGLTEQYPATDAEALTPKIKGKRLAGHWLDQCYAPAQPVLDLAAGLTPELLKTVAWPDDLAWQEHLRALLPALAQLKIYALPARGRQYVIGADPAEGNPTSDESAAEVVDRDTGEQVASLSGLYEPAVFGSHLDALSKFYNGAGVLVERNNHGHAVLLWLRDNSSLGTPRLVGLDGREGWLETSRTKSMLYDEGADYLRQKNAGIHSLDTYAQLASIEGATLSAPEGELDDRATAYMLAQAARARPSAVAQTVVSSYTR